MRPLILLLLFLSSFCSLYASPGNDSLPGGRAPQARFDPQAATREYLNTLSPAKKAKSDAYFEGGYWLLVWNVLYDGLVALLLLSAGLSRWIKKIAGRFRQVNIRNGVYGVLYIVIVYVLEFPLAVYQGFFREHQYDLSNQTFLQWFGENLITLALAVVMGGIMLVILYWAFRRAKARWWVWGAVITIGFNIIFSIIYPVFISPLFNKYTPLAEGPLKDQILSIARANRIPADNVYQFDASRQSDRISANVSGFGSTIRISLNDNLLKRCGPAEIKSVMGHEMGHYVLNHIYTGLVELGIVILIGFAFVNWLFTKLVRRNGTRWEIRDITDIGGLPLLAFLFSLYSFIATPVTNTITRTQEIEADQFGLNAAREPDGFAAIAMKLSEYRKIDPGYWEEIIFFDHPSGRNRVFAAMTWKAENPGAGEK